MFENPRRSRQARNFITNVPKIPDLKSSSEQIFFRKFSLGAPDSIRRSKQTIFYLRAMRTPLRLFTRKTIRKFLSNDPGKMESNFVCYADKVLSPHRNILIFTQRMHKPTERPFTQ